VAAGSFGWLTTSAASIACGGRAICAPAASALDATLKDSMTAVGEGISCSLTSLLTDRPKMVRYRQRETVARDMAPCIPAIAPLEFVKEEHKPPPPLPREVMVSLCCRRSMGSSAF
jgi:hypothetical protein